MTADIVVVGGGPVGLAFAIGASHLPGVRVTVIERGPATEPALPLPFDHRVYALSPGSLEFLGAIGASLPAERVAPVAAMQIWGDDGASELDFAAGRPLAAIVEHAAVMQALEQKLAADGRVRLMRGVAPVSMRLSDTGGDNRGEVSLADGSTIAFDLLIAADGARSQLRNWAGISHQTKDYASDGVVANFRCEHPHGDVARQWFGNASVLAFLPLPGNHVSIVWSVRREFSTDLPGDAAVFAGMVAAAGRHALGEMTLVSPVARFPLVRVMAGHWVRPGFALMGDAAHAVHPLAGQGVNLGFADARMMVQTLQGRSRFSAIGDVALLRTYERARREPAWAVGELTERLQALYASEFSIARWLRNDGLNLTNRLPAAKAVLVEYAAR